MAGEAAHALDGLLDRLQAAERERDEARSHLGVDPSMERIREAHSAMTALDAETLRGWHGAYKQGHDERCYICTLVARVERAEQANETVRREIESELETIAPLVAAFGETVQANRYRRWLAALAGGREEPRE